MELLRRGVECRIVDRLPAPAPTSRSLHLHARTLELCELAGIVDRFLDAGIPQYAMNYHFHGTGARVRIDFTGLDSRYPYFFVLSQERTEGLLRDEVLRLGGRVEHGAALEELSTEDPDEVVAVVRRGEGRERIAAGWVVGCDGVHSTTRGLVGLDYAGEDTYAATHMQMADVRLDGFPLPGDESYYLIAKDRFVLVVPLPGEVSEYRLAVSDLTGAPPGADVRSYLQESLDEHFGGAVTAREMRWESVFRVWRRLSSTYRSGRVLLAGDAAHTHSPAGGMGMNVCMQDAFNLGWKLALAAHGGAAPALLDTYQRERVPIARQVIDSAHALHLNLLDHGTPVERRLELASRPGFIDRAVLGISGLIFHYRDTGAAAATAPVPDGLAAGDRAPDADLSGGRRLYDLLGDGGHTLLLLPAGDGPGGRLAAVADRVRARAGGRVLAHGTSAAEARRRFGIAGADAMCLVRPDGYLAA